MPINTGDTSCQKSKLTEISSTLIEWSQTLNVGVTKIPFVCFFFFTENQFVSVYLTKVFYVHNKLEKHAYL